MPLDIVSPPPSTVEASSDDSAESRCLRLVLSRRLVQKRIRERGSYIRGSVTAIVSRSPDGGAVDDPKVIAIVDFICQELERHGVTIGASIGTLATSNKERRESNRASHERCLAASKRRRLDLPTKVNCFSGSPHHPMDTAELSETTGNYDRGTDDAKDDPEAGLDALYDSFNEEKYAGCLAMGIDPIKPTLAWPGSEDKVLMLSARYSAGLPLWHDQDCLERGPSEMALMGFDPAAGGPIVEDGTHPDDDDVDDE